jgi:glycosyltransferase involved in cell wall biosynthesis
MPAVSVIMNIFNGADTLREALQSTLDQTFTDWELIVWDDCSTDESAAIVESFRDRRIRYFLAPRSMSLGEARAAAIQQAEGDWLAFLDQDDVWLSRKLELQMALAESPAVGMIYGRTLAFRADGSQRDHDYFHEFCELPEGDIIKELLGRGCFVAMSSALLRRKSVQEAGDMPGYVRTTPDYFLYLAVTSRYKTRALQEVVCRYRVRGESMSSRYRRETLEETLLLVDEWHNHLTPAEYRRRSNHLATALAVEDLRTPGSRRAGAKRLWHDGSLMWLSGRPFVRCWRTLRRRIFRPYWKRQKPGT